MRRMTTLAGLALLLAGCMPPPAATPAVDVPRQTLTALDPASAQAALAQQLTALGFLVATEPNLVRAEIPTGAPAEWLICERVTVEDTDSIVRRVRWASPETHRVWLEARISRAQGGSTVTLSPYFEGLYRNTFNNLMFREECASAGRLEPLLFAAVSGR